MTKKNFIRVFIILFFFLIIFYFFFKGESEIGEPQVKEENLESSYSLNIIENVNYSSKDVNGNEYTIIAKKGEIWNIGSGNPQSINKLVRLLKPIGIINLPKRPGEPDVTYANINKIKKDLKWKPKISFNDGVQKVLNDINYWKKAPLWNKNSIKKATKTWFEYMN